MGQEKGNGKTTKSLTKSIHSSSHSSHSINQCDWSAMISDVASWGSASANSMLQKSYPSSPSSPQTINSLNSSVSESCRICRDGDVREHLISPCYCTGTVGVVHLSCLERWLGSSNNTRCELCFCDFLLQKKTRPFIEFLKNPGSTQDKKNLICDTVCFLVLTPMTICTAWLCILGALVYARTKWEEAGLSGLAFSLLLFYIIWLAVILRHNIHIWHKWSKHNQIVSMTYTFPESKKGQGKTNEMPKHFDRNHLGQQIAQNTDFVEPDKVRLTPNIYTDNKSQSQSQLTVATPPLAFAKCTTSVNNTEGKNQATRDKSCYSLQETMV